MIVKWLADFSLVGIANLTSLPLLVLYMLLYLPNMIGRNSLYVICCNSAMTIRLVS